MHSHDTTPPRVHFLRAAAIVLFLLLIVRASEAQSYTVPCGEDVHASITRAGNPSTVSFAPGCTYRLTRRIDPRAGQTFEGNGATLSGARVLTNVQQDSNGRYYYAGQIQQGTRTTVEGETICRASAPRCNYPELLLVDGEAYEHVNDYNKLAAGKWYFDYPGKRIFLYDNPTGRVVETSIANCAICGAADDVTVKDLEITGFGTPTENAAVEAYIVSSSLRGRRWVIENNYIHHNSAVGAVVREGGIIRNNRLEDNGQSGYGAGGQPNNPACNMVIEWNIIRGNNWTGVSPNFSTNKISYACNPTVQHNRSWDNHDSRCYWFDLDVSGIKFQRNYAGDGCMAGVYFEMGSSGVIEYNTFENASIGGDGNQHAAILVTNSSNVIIRFNTITLCETGNAISIREDGGRPSRQTDNIRVEDNLIEFLCGRGRNGWDVFGGAFIPAGGIDYKRNTYRTTNAGYRHFSSNNVQMTIIDWQKLFDTELLATVDPIPQPTVSATMTATATLQPIPATIEPTQVQPSVTPGMTLIRRIVVRYENGRWIIEEFIP